jgi:hypothetical protein
MCGSPCCAARDIVFTNVDIGARSRAQNIAITRRKTDTSCVMAYARERRGCAVTAVSTPGVKVMSAVALLSEEERLTADA